MEKENLYLSNSLLILLFKNLLCKIHGDAFTCRVNFFIEDILQEFQISADGSSTEGCLASMCCCKEYEVTKHFWQQQHFSRRAKGWQVPK